MNLTETILTPIFNASKSIICTLLVDFSSVKLIYPLGREGNTNCIC